MDAAIRKAGESPWSDKNIKTLCSGKVNVMTVKQAVQTGDIDAVLGPHGAAAILFETSTNYGHWIALIRVNDNTVEWFDSYGLYPNEELTMIPKGFASRTHQDAPYLAYMLRDGGYTNLLFNEEPLQSSGRRVSTCGRWTAVRIAMKHISLKRFVDTFTGQTLSPDDYVILMTMAVN